MNFIGNKAYLSGGGIMASSDVVDHARNFLNRFCFLRFQDPDVPPQDWKVSVPGIGLRKDCCFKLIHKYSDFDYMIH